ncbi:S1 family peptidase [Novosphingobium humi]|uniref:S1 family peptidase n=1 Tax=Novosphingobium humi TaxID=2282397 RepID=UPI0025AF01DC|nr:serine protease [Novosphingobium humi]WJS97837.1 serine protease [Novosphingobium humi]
MAELSLFERMLFSTVKITVLRGEEVTYGTGFFYQVKINKDYGIPLLVTNKHVMAAGGWLNIRIHIRNKDGTLTPSGNVDNVNIYVEPGKSFEHPNPNIDICAIPITEVLKTFRDNGKDILYIPVNSELIPSIQQWKDFDAIEDIYMFGCPNGIYDDFNNNPIVRRGITATPMGNLYQGKPEFLVDMACFPGSSGSPIFLVNQAGHFEKNGGVYNLGINRVFFVGILYAGPTISVEGRIVLSTPPVYTNTMMHLGNAIRSSEIIEIENIIRSKNITFD